MLSAILTPESVLSSDILNPSSLSCPLCSYMSTAIPCPSPPSHHHSAGAALGTHQRGRPPVGRPRAMQVRHRRERPRPRGVPLQPPCGGVLRDLHHRRCVGPRRGTVVSKSVTSSGPYHLYVHAPGEDKNTCFLSHSVKTLLCVFLC